MKEESRKNKKNKNRKEDLILAEEPELTESERREKARQEFVEMKKRRLDELSEAEKNTWDFTGRGDGSKNLSGEDIEEYQKKRSDEALIRKVRQGQVENPFKIESSAENVRSPLKFTEKISNFWFHYKMPFIIASLFVIFVAYLIVDSVNRERYDLTVMIASKYKFTYVSEQISEILNEYVEDIDENGEVNIAVDVLELNPGQETYAANYAKLVTTFMSGENIIYIFDDEVYEYLAETADVFEDLSDYGSVGIVGNRCYIEEIGIFDDLLFFFKNVYDLDEIPDDLSFLMRMPNEGANNYKKLRASYYIQKQSFLNIINTAKSAQ